MTVRHTTRAATLRPWGFLAAFLTLLACLLLVAPAQATTITGIADENLEEWSAPSWTAFNATGVKQVRHIVPWDVAYRQDPREEAEKWVAAAEARGLKVLISFGHNEKVTPLPQEYLNAVAAFRQNPAFDQITEYTAWNEPNHHLSKWPDAGPDDYPQLAAGYWVNLNFVCHLPQYGPTCTVAAGDFLDPSPSSTGEGLKNYIKDYKAQLAESKVSPSVWAIHPYSAAETGDWSKVKSKFLDQTSGDVWFTEVGGMVCRPPDGSGGPTAAEGLTSEQFQKRSVERLLAYSNARVKRTYYYALSAPNGGSFPCEGPGTKPDGTPRLNRFDSNLLSSDIPRPAYYTAFPGTTFPRVSTGFAAIRAPLQMHVFKRGNDNSLQHRWWTTSGWSEWENLGGTLGGKPVALSWGSGHLDIYARWIDGSIRHRWYLPASGWSAWESLGGNSQGDPTVVSWGQGRVDVFFRGSDNALWHRWFDGGQWAGSWASLGGTLTSDPASISWGTGYLNVFVRGTNNTLYQQWYAPTTGWSGWQSLGGSIASKPIAVSWAYGHMDVYARGTDNSLWHTWFGGSPANWQAWENLGGTMQGAPGLVSMLPGSIGVFVRGSENNIWTKWYDANLGATWSGWSSLGGPIASDPYGVSMYNGAQNVFALDASNEVGNAYFYGTPPTWNQWTVLK